MIHEEQERTKHGNFESVPISIYLQWIIDSWESLPEELIINSFKSCGITNVIDESENDLIHCFKETLSSGLEN